MGDVTTVEMMRGLYDYHHWANRRLFDVAVALGEDVAVRDLGKQFSFPTIKAMFTHIYGADFLWFQCWKAMTPVRRLRDGDFPTLAAVRPPWDEFEKEQAEFIEALTPADLTAHAPWEASTPWPGSTRAASSPPASASTFCSTPAPSPRSAFRPLTPACRRRWSARRRRPTGSSRASAGSTAASPR